VFAQDDYAPASWLTVSASGRVDAHNEAGTFFSPRVSALLKPAPAWTLRLSTGTGFFAPTPFTEETEATGLSRLAPLGRLEPERGRSVSLDLGWKRAPLEVTATLFRSVIENALLLRETGTAVPPVEIVNSSSPSRTIGSELIARFRRGDIDLLATHMFVWGTEDDPDTGARREVPFNPRHTSGIDLLWDFTDRGRLGVELFYTGRQQLDDSPFRERSEPYLLWGFLAQWRLGRSIAYVNSENLSNVRQARYDPLVRPRRAADGFWTVDAWAPLDGRMINAGVRLRF
jgi:iron complex outermembrane receptor protein